VDCEIVTGDYYLNGVAAQTSHGRSWAQIGLIKPECVASGFSRKGFVESQR
jgi:hypothetical protein